VGWRAGAPRRLTLFRGTVRRPAQAPGDSAGPEALTGPSTVGERIMGLSFSRETALRIGRAAQALPGVPVAALVDGLAKELGWPLDESALDRVTLNQLRNAL